MKGFPMKQVNIPWVNMPWKCYVSVAIVAMPWYFRISMLKDFNFNWGEMRKEKKIREEGQEEGAISTAIKL